MENILWVITVVAVLGLLARYLEKCLREKGEMELEPEREKHVEEKVKEETKKELMKKNNFQEQKEEQNDATACQQTSDPPTHNVRELFLETLTNIGCQYKLGEGEDTRIFFDYQGEHFFADMNDDSMYVHIWDIHWGHVELYDIDEVSRLRKAINNSNLNTTVITVFTIDEDAKTMDVHCKTTIPFIASIPHLENYLRVELNEFFLAHQAVGAEMHKLREQEQNA